MQLEKLALTLCNSSDTGHYIYEHVNTRVQRNFNIVTQTWNWWLRTVILVMLLASRPCSNLEDTRSRLSVVLCEAHGDSLCPQHWNTKHPH